MSYRAYAGVGSRDAPADVLALMRGAAMSLKRKGWTLRSGGTPGADQAFEQGATVNGDWSLVEVYLPWPGFEQHLDNLVRLTRPTGDALRLAAEFHPVWERLSKGTRALHARNVHQVLGANVRQPVLSKFVLCWTKGGRGGGGTGQAIRIARHHRVPVFDLALPQARGRVELWLMGDEG